MRQREGDVGLDEAGLVAAIEAPALEPQAVEGLPADQASHGVSQLNLVARPGLLPVQFAEDLGLQDVAPDDASRGWRIRRLGLLDQPHNLDQAPVVAAG